jgi:hypothetical protein
MLVEQEQDLRKLGEDWRMTISQGLDLWEVILAKDVLAFEPVLCVAIANNPKRAFREAFKKAKKYEDSLKKSS